MLDALCAITTVMSFGKRSSGASRSVTYILLPLLHMATRVHVIRLQLARRLLRFLNTWGIEDVRFTENEYEDYFLRFCKTHLGKMKDENDIRYLQEYVHNTTARHPGLVAFFMNHIKDHFSPQLKYDDTLKFERIFLYLKVIYVYECSK
jgi:hypothetical protein